jgi:tetratricopeptide (TPR) repeat protein
MAKSPTPASTGFAEQLLEEAINHHRAGRLSQAETCYQKILTQDPAHADALHLRGLVAYQQGQYDRALDCVTKAVQRDATKPLYFYNLGLVHQTLNQLPEAERAYRQALSLKGDYIEALENLGNVLREKGALDEACAAYQQVLTIRPDHPEGYNNLGVVLKEQGQRDEARDAYRRAIALNPANAEAHYNLGVILFEDDCPDEAVVRFRQAVSIKPQYAKAHHHLGLALLWKQDMDGALHELRTSAHLLQNHGKAILIDALHASRIKHDADQIHYLAERGLLGQPDIGYQTTLTALRERASGEANQRINLSQEEARALAPSLNRILHYADNPALPQGALNPELNVEEIERRYNASQPEIVYIDTLLRSEALAALQQFCRESTIWKKDYEDGYIGAFLGEGFSSPLLLQVAEELRTAFPGIFHQHRLLQAWAFKQDSARRPLKIHADAAAVNVNFWITPDDANLDPASGGLIVWDKEAPRDWDFKVYNSTAFQPKIRDFLNHSGASPVKVPYRANRALVFNSDLFHESDTCVFRDDYESRRINITFLYGRRR